jgi:hypothetical protein
LEGKDIKIEGRNERIFRGMKFSFKHSNISFVIPFLTFEIYTPVLKTFGNAIPVSGILTGNNKIENVAPVTETNYLPSILLEIYILITTVLLLRFCKDIHWMYFWSN